MNTNMEFDPADVKLRLGLTIESEEAVADVARALARKGACAQQAPRGGCAEGGVRFCHYNYQSLNMPL